jgi:hypothetical protein
MDDLDAPDLAIHFHPDLIKQFYARADSFDS